MHMEVSVMAQAASLETAEHGLPGEHGSNKHTVENTYGIPTGSLIWALVSHQISRIHWLKGLAPYVPPRLGTGVLEDSTGFARLGNSLENTVQTPCPSNAKRRNGLCRGRIET